MAGLDRIVEAAPTYEKLFMRWQRQHWSTEDFDFSEDARQWADPDLITDEEREFLLFGFSQFFLGEERVTVELLPFAMGAPSHEAQAFLTTQISDEAKHMVFFDRFYREVLGASAATIGDMLDQQRAQREQGLGAAVRRDPPRLRRAAAQGPERLRGAGPRDHRLHGRDRGNARPDRRAVHHPQPQGARLVPRLHGRDSPP